MFTVSAVFALAIVCHAAGFNVAKSVSSGNADMQVTQHKNVNQLSNDHETINEKLDKLLDMFGRQMVEDNIRSVTESVNQLEIAVASIQTEISLLSTNMLKNRQELDQLKQDRDARLTGVGTSYIRWGRTECPRNGSDLVYQGFAGGSWYQHTGAASSMLCLPTEPEWAKFDDKEQVGGYIYGTEYRGIEQRLNKLFQTETYLHDVPCAVCSITRRPLSIMIPARTSCYPGWTLEYRGYLMSGNAGNQAASDYYCVDTSPETVHGGSANQLGYLLHFVESRCGSLKCPPYENGRELACVVCSK